MTSHYFGGVLAWIIVFGAAYSLSSVNYVLFHTLAEIFTIIVSIGIAIIVLNSRRILKNNFIKIIGIAYAFAGGFDLLHTLAYKGMGVFSPTIEAELATQMWLIARFLDSIGMFVAGMAFSRNVNPRYVLMAYVVMAAGALLAVFHWQVFPSCFVAGQGLTPFKVYSEYLISLLFIAGTALLMRNKEEFQPKVFRWLMFFYLASICTELALTTYREVYGWQNMAGHLLKISAFFSLYRVIVETGIKEPLNLLFYQLNQANDLLNANETKLKETQRLARVGTWEWDMIKNETRWSDQTYLNLGYTEQEFTPTAASFIARVHPQDRRRVEEALLAYMTKESYELDCRIIKPDDAEGWIRMRSNTVFDKLGNPVKLLGALADITEIKLNELKLQHSAAEVAEANKELRSFANIVAHDLRAPLVNLKGFSREVEQSLANVKTIINESSCRMSVNCQAEVVAILDKDMPEALSFIQSSVDRMDRMITALLNLSRLGRRELVYQEVDMTELVNSVLRSFNHQVEVKDIDLEIGPLPLIKTDYLAMEQIMSNLLENAIKFLEQGRHGRIVVACAEGEGERLFCVQDNGCGIALEDQDKIFEIFQRVGSREVAGEGMGLAYVRALIRQLGGRVWCKSEPGVGTTICFAVPKGSSGE